MKSKLKQIISISILILIVITFVYYITSHLSDFKHLSLTNPLYLIPLVIIFLINAITNGLILKYILEPFKIKMKFKEWFGLSIITTFYNIILPLRAGMATRAVYLKKKYNFPYTHFISTLAGIYIINFLIASILGLISLWILYLTKSIFNLVILIVFLGFFIPLLIIILFSPIIPETKSNFINKFIKVINGWHVIRKNKKMIFLASLVILTQIILISIGTIISYNMFNININFIDSLFLSSIGVLSIVISITPGSLGIAETIAVFSALIIGITPAQSLTVAILNRAINILIIIILGPIYSYILLKHKPKSL